MQGDPRLHPDEGWTARRLDDGSAEPSGWASRQAPWHRRSAPAAPPALWEGVWVAAALVLVAVALFLTVVGWLRGS